MPAYARIIKIGGRDYTAQCESCSFAWERSKGCGSASLTIQSASLDDFRGIVLGEVVQIYYSSGDSWYYGIVREMTTSLTGGLSIDISGIIESVFQDTNVSGMYGTQATTQQPANFTAEFEAAGVLGEGYHTYYLAAKDDKGTTIPAGGDWSLAKAELLAAFESTGAFAAISGALTNSATSFSFATNGGARFPASNFVVRIDWEDILVATRSGDTCSGCTRGYFNTKAKAHVSGAIAYGGNNARRALLSWDSAVGAKYYRVYKAIYPAMVADPPASPAPRTIVPLSATLDDIKHTAWADASMRNLVSVTAELAANVAASDLSFTVKTGMGARFPSGSFMVRIYREVIYVGARSGDTFSSLTRGYNGTAAAPHGTNSIVTTGNGMSMGIQWDSKTGSGSATRPTPSYYAYIDTPDTIFYDDGTIDWSNLPAVVTLPAATTSRVSLAASDQVIDIVKYLVSTYASAHYDVSLITGGSGTDHVIDIFNLDDADVNLAQAMDTLANYVKDITYGINGDGKFYFKSKITTTQSDFMTYVQKTFKIGDQFGTKDPSTITDVLLEATRSTTRDGITEIRVMGNPAMSGATGKMAFDWLQKHGSLGGLVSGGGGKKSNDGSVVEFTVNPNAPALTPTYDYINSYLSATAFETDYPGLGWVWKNKDLIARSVLEAWLQTIAYKYQKNPQTGQTTGCSRASGVALAAPGIESEMAAGRVAAGVMSEALPVIGNWNLTVDIATERYTPGEKLVIVQAQSGKRYVLEIQSASYDFNECCTVSLKVGEMDILSKDSTRGMAYAASSRAGRGGPGGIDFAHLFKQPMPPITLGSAKTGTSPVPAPSDHTHAHDPAVINLAIVNGTAAYPNIPRVFRGETLTAINAMANTASSTYVRGLVFIDGDSAVTTNDNGDSVTHTYDRINGNWVARGGTWTAYTGA